MIKSVKSHVIYTARYIQSIDTYHQNGIVTASRGDQVEKFHGYTRR